MKKVPSFAEMGVTSQDVQNALQQVKAGKLATTHTTPSKSKYIYCPIDRTLWDLKAVVAIAIDKKPNKPPPRGPGMWTTRKYEPDLKNLGFSIVKFDEENSKRELGINGFDASELDEPHTVYWANGEEKKNVFFSRSKESPVSRTDEPAQKTQATVNRYVRDSALVKLVKDAANGKCQSCGQRTFKTPTGEWFLEVHHKIWLREGGGDKLENMIALCPNCHRQEHHGVERKYR